MSDPLDIIYRPYPEGVRTYDTGNGKHWYRDDPVIAAAGIEELTELASSPNWQDRIRAEIVRSSTRITLPDQFPVLYERADSPNRARSGSFATENPWVISPDIDMLEELLPRYQELWDSYTSQWGPASRRVMTVGLRDGLSPYGVYRPGTTPEQVLKRTLKVHPDMRRRAPEWAITLDKGA